MNFHSHVNKVVIPNYLLRGVQIQSSAIFLHGVKRNNFTFPLYLHHGG